MNRPFYPNKLSQRRKRGSRRNGKDRGASSSCKGYTYIYRSLFPHTNFAVYSHATGTPITYRALFLIMEERGLIRGRSVRRGEKIEKRFLPIQVRTATSPLVGREEIYFEVRATVSRAIMSSSSVGITTTFTLLSLVESRASSPCILALSSLSISIPIYCISSQTYSRVVV